MPRKFKVALAIPPNNDVDVLANDLGLIAIIEKGKLQGFNIAIGGGMSARMATPIIIRALPPCLVL
jgi:sulfite reductase (NADPH) hemoprotein beta-component